VGTHTGRVDEHEPAGGEAARHDILRTPEAGARVIRGGALRGGGYGVGIVLGAVTSVFLLRALGVDDFGRYGTVAALVGIVSTLTDAGLTAVGSRELALRPPGAQRAELLRLLVALRLVLSVVAVLGAVLFAVAVGYDETMVWGTLLAGLGVLLVNTQATAMMPLSVELRLGAVTAFEVLKQALTLAFVAALALAGAELLPYFAVQALVGAFVLALTPPFVGGVRALLPRLDRGRALTLLREALPLAVAIAMNVLYLRLLVILVSLTQDETETGYYATAFRVFEMLVGIPTIILSVALPLLAVAGAEDLERLRYALQRTTEVAVVASLGLALVTTAAAAPAITLLFGDEYDGAVPMLQVQAWALVPLFLGQVAALALLSLRRQRAIALANAAAVAVVLLLGALLIPAWAGVGAAVAGVVTEAVLAVLLLALLRHAEPSAFPRFAFGWRPLVALAAGLAPLVVPGLGGWVAVALATGAFVAVGLAARAIPAEVFDALGRRGGG
jgi:O-antigen/teichoic acid export membrane protein